MNRFINFFLNILFPENIPGDEEINCHLSLIKANERQNINALFPYKEEIIKDLIWKLKYKKSLEVSKLFSKYIFEEIISEAEQLNIKSGIILPVPMFKSRKRQRGYNPADLLVKNIQKQDTQNIFSYDYNILKKIKNTKPQNKTNSRIERLQNLKNSYKIENPEKIKNKNVFVIDDVVTTGATLSEISKTLKNSDAKRVVCYCIAH